MVSTFTPSKAIEKPASGDYVNAWASPVNSDWDIIDVSFGGSTTLNAVAASGTVALTPTQYRPPNIVITGALTANVNYQLPSGVGGYWSILNFTTGAFTITFSSAGGGTAVLLTQGYRIVVGSDGTNVFVWAAPAGTNGQIQYNNGGLPGASSSLTWDNGSGVLGISGDITLTRATPTITFNAGGPHIGSNGVNRLGMYNDGTLNERINIQSSGVVNVLGARNLGSADTPGSGNLKVFAAEAGGDSITTYDTRDYTALQMVRDVGGVPLQNGTITVGVSSVSYNTTSDQTLKEDLGVIIPSVAWKILSHVMIHEHVWKATGQRDINAFAQELYEVYPKAVTPGYWQSLDGKIRSDVPIDGGKYIPWSVDYSHLISLIIPVVQDMMYRIELLEGGI